MKENLRWMITCAKCNFGTGNKLVRKKPIRILMDCSLFDERGDIQRAKNCPEFILKTGFFKGARNDTQTIRLPYQDDFADLSPEDLYLKISNLAWI